MMINFAQTVARNLPPDTIVFWHDLIANLTTNVPTAAAQMTDTSDTLPVSGSTVSQNRGGITMESSQLLGVQDYEYTPLEAFEIRLLKIQPELEHDVISCTLETFPLFFQQIILPEYAAFSYAWGFDQVPSPILINGRRFSVSANLHAALQEFRTSSNWFIPETDDQNDQPYFIWIDALCINQKDHVERSEQVKLMRKVYQQASCLTVWLGVETSDVEIAVATVKRLKTAQSTTKNDDELLTELNASPEEWIAVRNILQNPYFSRSWVVQEYGLGGTIPLADKGLVNSTLFCCGRQRVSNLIELGWKAASLAGYTSAAALQNPNPWAEIVNRLQVLRYARSMYHNELLRQQSNTSTETTPEAFQTTFAALLLSQCRTLSSDPKDKVYSILGLVEELGGNVVKSYAYDELLIDYSASPQQVFASSVRSIASATGRLDILGAAYKETSSLIKSSWTPDWTLNTTYPVYSQRNVLYFRRDLDFDCSPGIKGEASFADDLSSLTVRGFVLGKLIHISTPSTQQYASMTLMLRSQLRPVADIAGGCDHTASSNAWERLVEVMLLYLPTLSPSTQLFATAREKWGHRLRDWMCTVEESELEKRFISKRTSARAELVQALESGLDLNDDTLLFALLMSASTAPTAGGESIVVSSNGHIGRSSHRVKEDDLLCVILGCARPMILRPAGDHFELISEAFVPGVMKGEAIEQQRAGEWTLRDFKLQ